MKCSNMRWNIIILITFCIYACTPLISAATPDDRDVSFELNGRIINGTVAKFEDTKHQISIRTRLNDGYYFGAGHLCGGSLIQPNVVLSAAHCFVDYDINNGSFRPTEDFIVVMGNLDRYQRDNNTLTFDIKEVVFNVTTFNLYTYESDIALVFLNDSVPANYTRAEPISLTTGTVANGTICQVTGWGQTEEGYLSDVLLTVDVPMIDFDVCAHDMGFTEGLIRPGMLCAGYEQGERDACSGDSGGPLVCNKQLAGIVSWGVECALPNLPGVYTNVSYWSNWIESKLSSNGTGTNDATTIRHISGLMLILTVFFSLVMYT